MLQWAENVKLLRPDYDRRLDNDVVRRARHARWVLLSLRSVDWKTAGLTRSTLLKPEGETLLELVRGHAGVATEEFEKCFAMTVDPGRMAASKLVASGRMKQRNSHERARFIVKVEASKRNQTGPVRVFGERIHGGGPPKSDVFRIAAHAVSTACRVTYVETHFR